MELYFNSEVQDEYISNLKEQKTPCTVFTINGFQIRGVVIDDDETSIVVESDGESQLVYKHAISTIAPFQNHEERRQSRPYSNRVYSNSDRR